MSEVIKVRYLPFLYPKNKTDTFFYIRLLYLQHKTVPSEGK